MFSFIIIILSLLLIPLSLTIYLHYFSSDYFSSDNSSDYRNYTLVDFDNCIQAEFIFPDGIYPNTVLGNKYIDLCLEDASTKLGLSLDRSNFVLDEFPKPFCGKYLCSGIIGYVKSDWWKLNTNHYMLRVIVTEKELLSHNAIRNRNLKCLFGD